MIFSLFCLGILAVLLYYITTLIIIPYFKYRNYAKQFPGTFFPILGLSHLLLKSFKEKDDCWSYYKELGIKQPGVRIHVSNFGPRIVLQLLDPKLIKEFFSHQQYYTKGKFSKAFEMLVSTGLIRAEGEMWKQHRKLLSSMFHFEFLKQNLPLTVSTTREFLDELEKAPLENVEIMDEIQKITGEIVGRIFFGEHLNKYTLDGQLLTLYLAKLLSDISKNHRLLIMNCLRIFGLPPELSSSFRPLMQKVIEFRAMCMKIINDRKASNSKARDMLGLLLETQNNPNKDEAYSDEDIVNEFITFFSAGMDTTGHAIVMMLYLLYNHPKYRENLEQEIKNIYDREDPVSSDSLNEMEFTHAFLKETLRLYSPAPGTFNRLAQQDHKLLDIEIKKGTAVRLNPLYNYFNPKYFDEPEKFKPERWLNKSKSLDPFVYIPFSSGSRNCIGQHLSIIETKVIIAEFLKRFDFEVPEGYKLRMTMGFLYEPADKLTMRLIKRASRKGAK